MFGNMLFILIPSHLVCNLQIVLFAFQSFQSFDNRSNVFFYWGISKKYCGLKTGFVCLSYLHPCPVLAPKYSPGDSWQEPGGPRENNKGKYLWNRKKRGLVWWRKINSKYSYMYISYKANNKFTLLGLVFNLLLLWADPAKARGCSTNTVMYN